MQSFMLEQTKQQRDFVERQENEESKNPSVKLPKLELVIFNKNKLKEFWDIF